MNPNNPDVSRSLALLAQGAAVDGNTLESMAEVAQSYAELRSLFSLYTEIPLDQIPLIPPER